MTTARIVITKGDEVTDIVAIDSTGPRWTYTDVDGDGAAMHTAKIPDVGPGIYLKTSARGCSIAVADVEDFIAAIRETVAAVTTEAEK